MKLDKSNKDNLITVHFLSIMTHKVPVYGINVLPYINFFLGILFFRNFLLTFRFKKTVAGIAETIRGFSSSARVRHALFFPCITSKQTNMDTFARSTYLRGGKKSHCNSSITLSLIYKPKSAVENGHYAN